jgi:Glycoside hydrolase family 5 C-terminal domain/Cellulase (glycosyl hydrolase family 5)
MIKLDRDHFKDEHGRTLILRGVNLGGSSKVPFHPNGATWNKAGFYDHRHVSFVGRPFPLTEADEHFSRLRAWGFTCLRFLITWEAIEHEGQRIYDQEYLDYLYAVIKKAGEYGIEVFIDPHQDTWSRFTGGDGAPGWTLETVGFDLTKIHATGAAVLHQEHGDPFPRMIWPTNASKFACGTMFTLFFAGNDFAPQLNVDGVPIQEYLQSHYIGAVRQVAVRLRELPNVIGYDTLNEPSNGFVGEKDVRSIARGVSALKGEMPTILQGMLLGSGYPQKVAVYDVGLFGFKKTGSRLVNPEGKKVWRDGYEDVWKRHGVWGLDSTGQPVLHQPDYFAKVNDRPVNFHEDYFKPFANRFAREIRGIVPEAILFVEGVPSQGELTWNEHDEPNVVHAAHWYDGLTLFKKTYASWLGADARRMKMVWGAQSVKKSFIEQIARIVRQSDEDMNHAPTLIGEVGIPFDMQDKKAYRTGDFSMQIRALDATMTALEKNFVSFTLWNYTADNSNARGDQWNDEDLSLFSRDQMTGAGSIHDGGRALAAAVRPYPRKVPGEPLAMSFDIKKTLFEFSFRHADELTAPTEIFVPAIQYPNGFAIQVSDGTFELDMTNQTLIYQHTREQKVHTVRVSPKSMLGELQSAVEKEMSAVLPNSSARGAGRGVLAKGIGRGGGLRSRRRAGVEEFSQSITE